MTGFLASLPRAHCISNAQAMSQRTQLMFSSQLEYYVYNALLYLHELRVKNVANDFHTVILINLERLRVKFCYQ